VVAASQPDLKKLREALRNRKRLDKKLTTEERRYSKALAKAISKSVRYWRRRFELPSWPVFAFEEEPGKLPSELPKKGAQQAVANARVAEAVNEVYIWYRKTMRPEAVHRVIAHEMGHWITNDLWSFLFSVLDKKNYKEARRLIEHVIETYTIALLQPDRSEPNDPEIEEEVKDGR